MACASLNEYPDEMAGEKNWVSKTTVLMMNLWRALQQQEQAPLPPPLANRRPSERARLKKRELA